jgi:hypothetical protein
MQAYNTLEVAKMAKQAEFGNDTLCVIFRNDQQSLQGIFRYRVASTIEQVAQCMNDGFKIAVAVC